MKKINVIYWIATGLFAAAFVLSAGMYLTRNPAILAGFAHLGYPEFLIPFLGVAKLAGVIALLQNRFTVLKEWAYAGLTINLLGALWSHIAMGDAPTSPVLFLLLLAVSYVLYHKKMGFAPVTKCSINYVLRSSTQSMQ